MRIDEIPIGELLKDKEESLVDIKNCETALLFGVTTYSAGSVSERLDVNKKIVEKINTELNRRNL